MTITAMAVPSSRIGSLGSSHCGTQDASSLCGTAPSARKGGRIRLAGPRVSSFFFTTHTIMLLNFAILVHEVSSLSPDLSRSCTNSQLRMRHRDRADSFCNSLSYDKLQSLAFGKGLLLFVHLSKRRLQLIIPVEFPHTVATKFKTTGLIECVPDTVGVSTSTCSGPARNISAAVSETTAPGKIMEFSKTAGAKVLVIVGSRSVSPFDGTYWEDVMQHMAQRISWIDTALEMLVFTEDEFLSKGEETSDAADVAIVIAVKDTKVAQQLQRKNYLLDVPTLISFDSAPEFETRLGGLKVDPVDAVEKVLGTLPGSKRKEALKVLGLVNEAWARKSSDDVRFAILVLIDSYVTPVTVLKNLRATSLASVQCMIKNCRSQILACILDPDCRQALNCLQNCAPTDQVSSYRCIVSYESPKLEAFTLCVLQKHNCLGLSADILMRPDVQPLNAFRGDAVTHEIAEDLFIGWLGRPDPSVEEGGAGVNMEYSWRVVAGQNAAYDQFPCQYQMFYRGKSKGSMWYDPVFQVQTLDGRMLWRRRHYRVKRDVVPGTFYFTVLDNGVTSREFWRIVDVKDDLSWGLFYYSGAAAAAGQSYTGAILVTRDGKWPPESEAPRISDALNKCGIKVWELYRVNNKGCPDPPLGLPEGSTLHAVITS